MKRFALILVLVFLTAAALVAPAMANPPDCGGSTVVPGQCNRLDTDENGYTDAGVNVNGNYTTSQAGCDYIVIYRGDFGNDPYLNSGEIKNILDCGDAHWMFQIVHESDPRYTGNPEWSIWGTWEYHTLVESGHGNWIPQRPEHHVGG